MKAFRRDPVVELRRRRAREAPAAGVTRQQFRDFLLAERARVQGCTTLPLTVALWLVFALSAWLHGSPASMYRLQQGVSEAVRSTQVKATPEGSNVTTGLNLTQLSKTSEVWLWLADGLVPLLAGSPGRRGFVRTFNQVVGGIQLQQRRADLDSCGRLEASLADYFRGGCRSEARSGAAFGIALGVANATLAAQAGNGSWAGNFSQDNIDGAFVPGGGSTGLTTTAPVFCTWLDASSMSGSALRGQLRVQALQAAGWIDEATKSVEAKFALFNAEVRALVAVKVTLRFQSGGLMDTGVSAVPFPSDVFPSVWHIIVDVIWVLLLGTLFFLLMQELADRKGYSCCGRCASGWMLLDMGNLVLGLVLIGVFAFFAMRLLSVTKQLGDLASDASVQAPATSNAFESKVAQLLESMDVLVLTRTYHKLGMIVYLLLIVLRFFRGFAGQPRMAAIERALLASSADMGHLGLLLAVVFENFAIGGYVMFGAELKQWSSLLLANRSTLSVISGRGDFAAMQRILPVAAAAWLFLFILSTVFILSNVILAITVEHFGHVRSSFGQSNQGLLEQLAVMWSDWMWRVSYEFRLLYSAAMERASPKLKEYLPKPRREPRRVSRVPYNTLLEAVSISEEKAEGGPPPWRPIHEELLLASGCDAETARRLLAQCRARVRRHSPGDFPTVRLCEEFEAAMDSTYTQLSAVGEDLQNWLADRLVDCNNLEPRQRKLEILSKCIEPAVGQKTTEEDAPFEGSIQDMQGDEARPFLEDGSDVEAEWETAH